MAFGNLSLEVRLALRSLTKSRSFTAVAVLSLAIGIGANTAVFSLFDAVLLKTLPVERPQELAAITSPERPEATRPLSYPAYLALRDRSRSLQGVIAYAGAAVSFETERVQSELVTGNYFEVLGVEAAAGRLLTPADDRTRMGHPVVVLTHGFWRRRFGAELEAIGRTVRINGHPFTIIGVAAERFAGTRVGVAPEIFLPLAMQPAAIPGWDDALDSPYTWWLQAMVRLRAGTTLRQAEAELDTLYRASQTIPPEFANDPLAKQKAAEDHLSLTPAARGLSSFREMIETPLRVLLASVAMLLLLTCANVAGLFVARAAARSKEVSVRMALGASRWRLALQPVLESVLLSAAGGALAVAVAIWSRQALLGYLPGSEGVRLEAPMDWRVLLFGIAAGMSTALLIAALPVLRVAGSTLRKTLVGVQVALSVVLLAGATLFVRTLSALETFDAGIVKSNLITMNLDPMLSGYEPESIPALYDRILDAVRATPGVESATLATYAPFAQGRRRNTISVAGHRAQAGEDMNVDVNVVSPGYFETVRMQAMDGRTFDLRERDARVRSIVINQRMAQRFWPGESALGKRVGMGPNRPADLEVVGIVRDSRYRNVREAPGPAMFVPASLQPPMPMVLHARSKVRPQAVIESVRRQVATVAPALMVHNVRTVEEQLERALVRERMMAALSTCFGALALLLAATGLYGILAYSVARRVKEIAVRIALGATRASVFGLVARDSALVVLLGLAAGLTLAAALSRYLSSLLFGVRAEEPATYAVAAGVLLAAAAAATMLPARGALRIEPAAALRQE